MKKVCIVILVLLSVFISSCKNDKPKEIKQEAVHQIQKKNRIELLDFHTKHRCKACISIEANTRKTLDEYFSEDLVTGKLVFRLINADTEENEKIVEEYGAYGTSLFLNVIKDGKENHIDLTNFAFKTESNQEKFISELKSKIEVELKNI